MSGKNAAAKINSPKGINRVIPFEGVENFRDMGGYLTKDGRTVKYGHLYRSSALYYLTPQDQLLFKDLGIQHVFDYRDSGEAIKEPDPILTGVTLERLAANAVEDQMDYEDFFSEEYRGQLSAAGLTDFYRSLSLNNASYRRLVEIALDDQIERFVHHCAAGKDRTGIGAAIIYLALGVSRETIMEDYLLSNTFLPSYQDRHVVQVADVYSPQELEYFMNAFIVREDYLQTFFQIIDETYGDDETYLEKEFGLTEFQREKLRKKYLQK